MGGHLQSRISECEASEEMFKRRIAQFESAGGGVVSQNTRDGQYGNESDAVRSALSKLELSNTRLDKFHNRISACETSHAVLEGVKAAHDRLAKEHAMLERKHITLQERVDNIKDALAGTTSTGAPSSAVMIH